jgi:hypothetical protein
MVARKFTEFAEATSWRQRETSDFEVSWRSIRRNRHRIRPDRGWDLAGYYCNSQRTGHQSERQVYEHQFFAEVNSCLASWRPGRLSPGPLPFRQGKPAFGAGFKIRYHVGRAPITLSVISAAVGEPLPAAMSYLPGKVRWTARVCDPDRRVAP